MLESIKQYNKIDLLVYSDFLKDQDIDKDDLINIIINKEKMPILAEDGYLWYGVFERRRFMICADIVINKNYKLKEYVRQIIWDKSIRIYFEKYYQALEFFLDNAKRVQ